ncbi:actin patch protein [Plectosphaerella cucumerina]|uniref:Actin patch protein n=1 Tax=Plectosphaerella cucumerina TaxID=40658 RepID=A0A8K0TP46_9PEZI|nr:actin patch protein [Plectosphaerella cucumerina]
MPTLPGFGGGAGAGGSRRKRFAAMANNMYKAGASAVNEIKEGYAHIPRAGEGEDGHARTTIPGSFPDVAITVQGDDQMVLFPSYAKRHVKQDWTQVPDGSSSSDSSTPGSIKDEDYWRREWEKDQDERAIVDVDVRGWLYSPHKGPMTRRNRMLIGLARQLSGIPAPKADGPRPGAADSGFLSMHEANEERREQEQVARKAAEIESKGQEEKRVAYHGGYSEGTHQDDNRARMSSRPASIASVPGSPRMTAKEYTSASEVTDVELAIANANLMARLAPFMTTPLVELPITIFFYNDEKSASRTVQTDDAGHFVIRAALDFVPTHVRVLANSDLSTTQEVKITEPHGVSLISDIDDTIKRSNIPAGAKEIFRNTFIRELQDLTIDGVRECPWQLFPVLATYFMIAGLPPGSLHLKQYSGMLQGIFEPVAERKRGTLNRLLQDFPERRFLCVGDSGEADLEVYTELAVNHPGRILAVFIRDVTTPEETGFFSSSFDTGSTQGARLRDASDERHNRPALPPRGGAKSVGPMMGDLIDLSDEPAASGQDNLSMLSQLSMDGPRRAASTTDLAGRKAPPPPKKPAALRSTPSDEDRPAATNSRGVAVPLPPTRKPIHSVNSASDLLRNARMPAGPPSRASTDSLTSVKAAPPPPAPRRSGTSSSSGGPTRRASSANDDIDYDPLPAAAHRNSSFSSSSGVGAGLGPAPPLLRKAVPNALSSAGVSPTLSAQTAPQTAADKKVELWQRRLQRAHEVLDAQGVRLYTWRRGGDVVDEALGIVKRATGGARGERSAKDDGGRWERELKREQGR